MPPSISPASVAPPVEPGASAGPTAEELLAALPDHLGPIPRSRAFRIRLATCSAVLLALLLIYVALLAPTSYGIWAHFASELIVAAVHRLLPWPAAFAFLCVAGP